GGIAPGGQRGPAQRASATKRKRGRRAAAAGAGSEAPTRPQGTRPPRPRRSRHPTRFLLESASPPPPPRPPAESRGPPFRPATGGSPHAWARAARRLHPGTDRAAAPRAAPLPSLPAIESPSLLALLHWRLLSYISAHHTTQA